MLKGLVIVMQLNVAPGTKILSLSQLSRRGHGLIAVSGEAEGGDRKVGERIMLVGQSRVGDALKVAGAASRRGAGFEHGHLHTASGQCVCRMGTCQPRTDDQSASSPHGLWIYVPRRQGVGQGHRLVHVAVQGIALGAVAAPFVHRETGRAEPSAHCACGSKGRKRCAGLAQGRHRVIHVLLPRPLLPGGCEAIEVPGIDPWLGMTRQITQDLDRIAPPEIQGDAPFRETPAMATRKWIRPSRQ